LLLENLRLKTHNFWSCVISAWPWCGVVQVNQADVPMAKVMGKGDFRPSTCSWSWLNFYRRYAPWVVPCLTQRPSTAAKPT